jgi:PilZ domain
VDILVDGNQAHLIDLSPLGAQVISGAILKPNQRVRISMVDERVTLRCQALIVWARFELAQGGQPPYYRAGIEFSAADSEGIAEYMTRHRRKDG